MTQTKTIDGLILSLINQQKVFEQREIQQHLSHHGLSVPQATISRRLKKLGVKKIDGSYRPLNNISDHPVLKIQISAIGLVVLHTKPGHAGSVSYDIDQRYIQKSNIGLIATIAGDDVVLLIPQSAEYIPFIVEKIYLEFPHLSI